MSIVSPGSTPPPPQHPELPAGVGRADTGPIVTWSPLTAWLGGIGLFAASLIIGGIAAAGLLIFGGSADDPGPAINFVSIVIQDSAMVIGVWMVVQASGSTNVTGALGIRPTRFWSAVGFVLLAYFVLALFSLAWDQIVNAPKEDLLEEVGADQTVLAAVAICFGVCVMAPLAEETLFRGFIFGGLRRWNGFWPAALISGAMFGLAHSLSSPLEALLPLAVFGFLLALIYERTKSIVPGMYLHCINNCVAFSVLLNLGWETVLVFVGSLSAITLALLAVRRMA